MEELIKRINTLVKVLDAARYTDAISIDGFLMKQVGYGQRYVMQEPPIDWKPFAGGSHWGGKDYHCCFKAYLTIPQEFAKKEIVIHVRTGATDLWDTDNPQFLAYIDHELVCAMDLNHSEMILTECAEKDRNYEIGLYAYSNSVSPSIVLTMNASVIHRDVEKLYYDLKVPFEVASLLRDDDIKKLQTIQILAETVNLLDTRKVGNDSFYRSIKEADQYLRENYYDKLCGRQEISVHSIGHTHIDIAWKWTLKQTREKAIRSFQTVLYLMNRYPEYKFMSSQPQLYEFVKEDCPEVYEQIRNRVAQGRWETEGAMWLEADCNLISGESLIRQIMYGKQFFQQEFGKGDNLVLWLPDVFGYSAAMPQILLKSGIRYFMTTKIAWNESNQIPNDVMMWKGIDGTEILTYFITTRDYNPYPELQRKKEFSTTYNGRQNASQIMGTWQRFQNKNLLQEVLTCYGFGDGGGGATGRMLEESRRMEQGIPGCPITRQTFVKDFFQLIEKKLEGKRLPKWYGELYLEYHRGTYTSMARNKRYNRLCEFLNTDVELFSVLDQVVGGMLLYPEKELKVLWKLTMLNQFHDILPGSSIKEVYDDSQKQYKKIIDEASRRIRQSLTDICKTIAVQAEKNSATFIVWNQLGFRRDVMVEFPLQDIEWDNPFNELEVLQEGEHLVLQYTAEGKLICQVKDIPSMGWRTLKVCRRENYQKIEDKVMHQEAIELPVCLQNNRIETPYYSILLNGNGEIISLIDKEEERELLPAGGCANQLIVYQDRPAEYDAWNIDSTYIEKYWTVSELKSLRITEHGPLRTCIHITHKFMDSIIDQDMILYSHSRRIDFKTVVDWKESQLLLKVAFPMDITTDKAVYEIQYGNVERPIHQNTSWEKAKFEVCAHKWADLAEDGYGVALLNDCKYGYDINESVIRLTLIKSGIFPNPEADQEIHQFTYSLLPHKGDFRMGRVIQEAYDLNRPPYSTLMDGEKRPAADQEWSFLEVNQDNVVVEVLKKAEDSNDIIMRMYEAYGRRTKATITLKQLSRHDISECDLMERDYTEKNFEYQNGSLSFVIKPYEIKTFRIHA